MLCFAPVREQSPDTPLTAWFNGRRRASAAPDFRKCGRSDSHCGCHPGLSETSLREEGGYERRNATWSVRPADARAGFSSVMLPGFPLAVPNRHLKPHWTNGHDASGGRTAAGGTQAPGIDEVSPDWKLATPDIVRVPRAATPTKQSKNRRPKRHPTGGLPPQCKAARGVSGRTGPRARLSLKGRRERRHPEERFFDRG